MVEQEATVLQRSSWEVVADPEAMEATRMVELEAVARLALVELLTVVTVVMLEMLVLLEEASEATEELVARAKIHCQEIIQAPMAVRQMVDLVGLEAKLERPVKQTALTVAWQAMLDWPKVDLAATAAYPGAMMVAPVAP
jgi:hypothetical protein